IERVGPKVIVCLGATAAQALISRDVRVSRQRGELMKSPLAPLITATVHPSSILRSADEESRHLAMREFVADLKKIARHLPPSALKRNKGRALDAVLRSGLRCRPGRVQNLLANRATRNCFFRGGRFIREQISEAF